MTVRNFTMLRSPYTHMYANEQKLHYTATEWLCSGAVVVGHMRQSMGARRNWYHRCPIRRNQCIRQTDCSSRDSRLSLLTLLSAYCLTILMHCGWRCRQQLYATASASACRALPQPKYWLSFFCFFFTAILVLKKEKKRKCGYLKRQKITKFVFWRRKIKRKRNSVGLYCRRTVHQVFSVTYPNVCTSVFFFLWFLSFKIITLLSVLIQKRCRTCRTVT